MPPPPKIRICDSAGHPRFILGLGEDVAEAKRTEAALRESEARFRQLMEQSLDPIFVQDFDARIIDVNPRACESLGYTREELLQMSVVDIDAGLGPECVRTAHAVMRDVLPSAKPVTIDTVHRRKDGSTFPVEIRSGVIEIGGRRYVHAIRATSPPANAPSRNCLPPATTSNSA